MRKIVRVVLAVVALAGVAAGVSFFAAYRASQHVPEFYEKAIARQPESQAEASHELVKQVFDLRNDVNQVGQWKAVFTDEQINGWLAADLPAKFPDALPKEIHDPRVAIDPQQAQIACRYESSKTSTVVSLALEIHLTDEPNVVAVRIRQARAGLLPLPVKQGLDKITAAARAAGIPLRWVQKDGDPVALITVPAEHEQYSQRLLRLETIELRSGEVFLSGQTEAIKTPIKVSQSGGQ